MSALNCEICFKPFGSAALPRILPCGHSCCSLCLGQILTSSKCCPFCRKVLTESHVEQYLVNYSTLKICEELSNSPYNMANFQRHLQLLHENIILKADEHRSEVEKMKTNETKLLNFMATDDCSFNEVGSSLETIELTMNNVAKIFSWIDDSANLIDFKIDSSKFKSDDWTNFLTKIPEGLALNQKFAALLIVDGVKKFAKLSIYENYLCIHSLETLEDTHDFITICFQSLLKELLTCSSSKGSIYSFFDLQYRSGVLTRKVMVQVTDPTNYASCQFLKFCTGELGASYKGHEYTQSYGNKMELNDKTKSTYFEHILIQTKQLGGKYQDLDIYPILFSPKDSPRTWMPNDSCFLTCTVDGAFEIQLFEYSSELECPNVIGPIVDFKGDLAATFRNATLRKIIDCGIAFKVDL